MKSPAVLLMISICSLSGVAQTFQKKTSWKDNSFSSADAKWVDLNNDSLLDVIISGKSKTHTWQIKSFKNVSGQEFVDAPVTTYNASVSDYAFTDINHDNLTDIMIIGQSQNGTPIITSFINQKNFAFITNEMPGPDASNIHFADLDNDGTEDLILSGNQYLKILKATPQGYLQKFDSSGVAISGLAARDFNGDGQIDIVVSGKNHDGAPALFIMTNAGKFKFRKQNLSGPHSGLIESGDFTHDGMFDFVVGDSTDEKIAFYTNRGDHFDLTDSLTGYNAEQLFSADFNSDGLTDLSISGKQPDGKRFNLIQKNDQTILPLDTTGLRSQQFGDYDRDGDLDLLRIIDSASFHEFQVFENTTVMQNARPSPVPMGFGINTPQGTFIYWEQAADDLTPENALTYDLLLISAKGNEIVAPEFDLSSQQRQRPVHGSQTTNHFAIIKGLPDQQYSYLIQAVDNSFNGSICKGGGVLPCFSISHEYVQACEDSPTTLTSPIPAYWFSLSEGFIGISATYDFIATKNDTLYSFVPVVDDCSKNKVWVINVNKKSVSEKETKFACKNIPLKLGIAPGWKVASWTIGTETITGDTVTLKAEQAQIITVNASNNDVCNYKKEFNIKISEPTLVLNADAFTISAGQSANLAASGLQSYIWQPSTGLNNAFVSDPIASPNETTTYTVNASDSVGCQVSGKIIVYVEEKGFIPSLFTPNGDGKNDELKIYGVTDASQFRFTIFNREGTTVYETKDINLAVHVGWNGTHGGTDQNSGLYYWKVEGRLSTGQSVTLNGKSTGSILLIK